MTDIEVRPATHADLPSAASLRWRWSLENGQELDGTEAEYAERFAAWADAAPQHEFFVALRAGQVIGMAWLAIFDRVPAADAFDRRTGDLQSVYVVPEERNGGVGGRLVEAVLRRARELGLQHVTVHSSSRAIPAYQRAGFQMVPQMMYLDPRA
ncbi:MAG: GNAT family N-acetyltransferase [Hamadaea sp.]|nr:GNAT family N-acetyltransferase [Hamadaea sp.]